jgi:hypothetical protein
MDLLAEHDDVSDEGLEILEGLRIVRIPRRPRRGAASTKPFDAEEVHLADATKPLEDWRPSALLRELRDQTTPPTDSEGEDLAGRFNRVSALLDRLVEHGLDGERLLRSIFVDEMSKAVVTMTAIPLLLGSQRADSALAEISNQTFDAWAELLLSERRPSREWFDRARSEGAHWVQDQVHRIFGHSRRIAAWMTGLSLPDLIAWRVPTPDEFSSVEESAFVSPSAEDQWGFDRFMQTYLESWNFESLLLEWRYVHGTRVGPCLAEAMRTRQVGAEDLARVIAAKAASGETAGGGSSLTVSGFVKPALEHLQEGRHATAAAIFDACRIAAPSDAEAHNNYGFCVLPTDPQEALAALETAAQLGMRYAPVNVANRMLALVRLGRPATALEVASRFAATRAWSRPAFGFLWSWDAEPPKLSAVEDIRLYVAAFALDVATNVDDDVAIRSWKRRLGELEHET